MKKIISVFMAVIVVGASMGTVAFAETAANGENTTVSESASTATSSDSAAKSTHKTKTSDKSANKKAVKKSGKAVRVDVLTVAADALGKTEDEVKESVKTGKVGDLLISAGKVDAFKTAYIAELKTKLTAAVTAGTLTQEQADAKLAADTEKITAYDGTTHLCGKTDHSKISEKKGKTITSASNTEV